MICHHCCWCSSFRRGSNSVFIEVFNYYLLASVVYYSSNATATFLASDAVVEFILKELKSKIPYLCQERYFCWRSLQHIVLIWISYKYNKGHLLATKLLENNLLKNLLKPLKYNFHLNYKQGACNSETKNCYTILQCWVKVLIDVNEAGLQFQGKYIGECLCENRP